MTILNRSATKRLDEYWDVIALGGSDPTAAAGVDRPLIETIHQLHALSDQAVSADAFARVWQRVGAQTVETREARERGRVGPTLPLWRRRPLAELSTAALLLLTLVGGIFAYSLGRPAPSSQPSSSAMLYVSDESGENWRRLDPLTLADLPGEEALAVGTPRVPAPNDWIDQEWALSVDGSTAVNVLWPAASLSTERLVTVYDGIGGSVRSQFVAPGRFDPVSPLPMGGTMMLSADGARLVLLSEFAIGENATVFPQTIEWAVYDTSDGRHILTVRSTDDGATWFAPLAMIDPMAQRLYQLIDLRLAPAREPHPASLVVHDLTSGAETGRIYLPDLVVGLWDWLPERQTLSYSAVPPGGAISPDGRQLAYVHADGTKVTLVDTERLVVEGTVTLSMSLKEGRPQAAATATVPPTLSTEVADPCQIGETIWRAVYAAEGSALLVSGHELIYSDCANAGERSLGLHRIDLATGQVMSSSSAIEGSAELWLTADGQNLYALESPSPMTTEEAPAVLVRIDPSTLQPVAERELAAHEQVMLWPRVPGS